jgi:hypothetical protein
LFWWPIYQSYWTDGGKLLKKKTTTTTTTARLLVGTRICFIMGRMTRRVCETIAQNVAQPLLSQNLFVAFPVEKSYPKNLGYLNNWKIIVQCKILPICRKFAQSMWPWSLKGSLQINSWQLLWFWKVRMYISRKLRITA